MSKGLIFSCTHLPYEHRNFLKFIIKTYKKNKCDWILCNGDFYDFHNLGFWDKEPEIGGLKTEWAKAKEHAKAWFIAFPDMYVSASNHDERPYRVAKKNGILKEFIVDPRRIFTGVLKKGEKDPIKGWIIEQEHTIDGVLYKHEHKGGDNSLKKAIYDRMCSVVLGHQHTKFRVEYYASSATIYFGANCACGIDRRSPAFRYGKGNQEKPILGCLIVEDGKKATLEIMPLK